MARREYPSDVDSPGRAREFCADHLAAAMVPGMGCAETAADAIVVLSELVSNAVHAGSPMGVEVALHRRHLRLSVFDTAPGDPRPQVVDHTRPRGRGLAIVGALAGSWGVLRVARGKEVWAVLDVHRSCTAGLECVVTTML